MSTRSAALLALALVLFNGCNGRPPFVVLTIEDADGLAAGAAALEVGEDLNHLQAVQLSTVQFPLTLTVTAPSAGERELWVEARTREGTTLGRGRTTARFATIGTPTATAQLARPCGADTDCLAESFCSGTSRCDDAMCSVTEAPCGSSMPCVTSTCVEATQSCDVTVDHSQCPAGSYCDAVTGCVAGVRCMPENGGAECQDGLVCNGIEQCVSFHCIAGAPPALDDDNPCTLDGCVEPTGPTHTPITDGNVCTLAGVARAICRAGLCLASSCGDGFTDRAGSETCDDGPQNSDAWSLARHCNASCSAWAPSCGDSIVERSAGEECDDGVNDGSPLGCMPDCTLPANCGDGRVATSKGETCDDGNVGPGDGCTPACLVQAGWSCDTHEPSRCTLGSMVALTAGTFSMGSPTTEVGRVAGETLHDVTLTHNFSLSNTELTQAEFRLLMSDWNPSNFNSCATCPVEQISWYDAVAYLNQLTLHEAGTPCYVFANAVCKDGLNVGSAYLTCASNTHGGISSATMSLNGVVSVYDCTGFRLPTEAEWEYAARAGDARATYNGDLDAGHLACEQPNPVLDPIAWFCGNAANSTHPKGLLAPNAWGLYDMLGNVWEWCHDWYVAYPVGAVTNPEGPDTSSYRAARGFGLLNQGIRTARRNNVDPAYRGTMGVRVARTLP